MMTSNRIADLATSVTEEQIEDLMRAAGQAGDEVQVAVCLVALGREEDELVDAQRGPLERLGIIPEHIDADVRAQAKCAEVIADAAAR